MRIVTKRLKTSDDFALDKLLEPFAMRLRLLPVTDAELYALLETLRVEDRNRLVP